VQASHHGLVADLDIRVRPAREADADAIGETHAAAWTAAYDHIFDPSFLASAAESRRLGWTHTLPSLLIAPSFVLVVERENEVVGFAHAGPEGSGGQLGEIHGFYVHPTAWGSGAAHKLMTQTCFALTTEWSDVSLWTLRDAGRARHFYEKTGFHTTGRERAETLADWTSGKTVERPAIEYAKPLSNTSPNQPN
jgi:GNAT superfamily N-acetyltransferase